MNNVLIIDDEKSIAESISMVLNSEGYITEECYDGICALQKISEKEFDLILLDIKMPKMDGLEVLEKIMAINKNSVVIMISGHGTIDTAVEATKKGAYGFLLKPLPDLPELIMIIRNAIDFKKSKDEIRRIKKEFSEANRIIGKSEKIKEVNTLINKFAGLNSNVLITGESGTGKELVARQIHLESGRSEMPFVEINSANLTEDKIESELFGKVENGINFSGKFEQAEGGTIFLDEVSNLSTEIQSKLLNVIETNKITKSGSNIDIQLDVRFIFATNKDLEEEVNERRFREDFYHRINVLQINIAPLRERPEDIPELVDYFTSNFCNQNNLLEKFFTEKAKSTLITFRWPGNVRELKNLVERLIIVVNKKAIDYEDIDLPGSKHVKEFSDLLNKNMSLNDFQTESERVFIIKMLNDYNYNKSQTAEALKIQRSHLYNLIKKYNISIPDKNK